MTFRVSTLALVMVSLVCPAFAEGPSLAPGELVRIHAPSLQRDLFVGRVVDVDDTRFQLLVEKRGLVTIPREAVARLQWSAGPKRQVTRGLVVGALLGAAILGSAALSEGDGGFVSTGDVIVAGAFLGGLSGAGLGAIAKQERWQDVASPEVASGRQRALVGVSLRF